MTKRETVCQSLTLADAILMLEPLCQWGNNDVDQTVNRIRSAVILLRDALETED